MLSSFTHLSLKEIARQDILCACGLRHQTEIRSIHIGPGALLALPEVLAEQRRADGSAWDPKRDGILLVEDENTRRAAGDTVLSILTGAGYAVHVLCFPEEELVARIEEVERVEAAIREDTALLIAVGSGTLNDITKYAAFRRGLPFYIVGTAPSMDGYASPVAPMLVNGVKYALDAKGPEAIIGDIDIIRLAPGRLMAAGYGDVAGKCVSICDWKVSSLVTGEAFCETVANTVLEAAERCTENLDGLLRRDGGAVQAVMEALVLCGEMMSYVKSSRPASGSEHNFSHIVEMMQLFAGEPVSLHGESVAVGSVVSCVLYQRLLAETPNLRMAEAALQAWSEAAWAAEIHRLCPVGAEDVFAIEEKTRKNKADTILPRLQKTIASWPEILQAVRRYVPSPDAMASRLAAAGAPATPAMLAMNEQKLRDAVRFARDMRYRYSILQMIHDMGRDDCYIDEVVRYFNERENISKDI